MNRIVADKTYYEIQGLLGEGLTSQVYKAFRVDGSKYTSQPVALKVVKSRKHIQVLRKEFEKLQKVDSKNCVKVYGWENLKTGPALVLELLEGLTLEELHQRSFLTEEIIDEITMQVQRGLSDIHQKGLIHGDLNLKNIFITQSGTVKLLDFGVLQNIDGFFGTPSFVAPEVWRQEKYCYHSDLFSLGLIRETLNGRNTKERPTIHNWSQYLKSFFDQNPLLMKNKEERVFLKLNQCHLRKAKLKNLVMNSVKSRLNVEQTIVVKTKNRSQKKLRKKIFVLLVSSVLALIPSLTKSQVDSGLEVRTHQWLRVSVNGLPAEFAPFVKKRLRPGKYQLLWVKGKQIKKREVQLLPHQRIILKPESINL